MRPLAVVTLALSLPCLAAAQSAPQPIVVNGLKAWVSGHCPEAIRAWTSKWSKESGASGLVGGCADFATFGTVHGYDIIRVMDVTPNLQRVYVLLRYAVQPVYLSVVAYAADTKSWEVMAVNWNSDPDKIVPPQLLPPQHVNPVPAASRENE